MIARKKYTDADRALRRELYYTGFTDAEIADRTGYVQATVSRWRRRNRYTRNFKPEIRRMYDEYSHTIMGRRDQEEALEQLVQWAKAERAKPPPLPQPPDSVALKELRRIYQNRIRRACSENR